jgi:hypothetical protein
VLFYKVPRQHVSQGATARRYVFLQSATRAMSQQHAGEVFCRAHTFLKEAGFVNFKLLFFIG